MARRRAEGVAGALGGFANEADGIHIALRTLRVLLMSLIPDRGAEVPVRDMVAVLTVRRCGAPASKLAFQRWLPRAASPELLGVVSTRNALVARKQKARS